MKSDVLFPGPFPSDLIDQCRDAPFGPSSPGLQRASRLGLQCSQEAKHCEIATPRQTRYKSQRADETACRPLNLLNIPIDTRSFRLAYRCALAEGNGVL